MCTITNVNIYLNMQSGSVHCSCHSHFNKAVDILIAII